MRNPRIMFATTLFCFLAVLTPAQAAVYDLGKGSSADGSVLFKFSADDKENNADKANSPKKDATNPNRAILNRIVSVSVQAELLNNGAVKEIKVLKIDARMPQHKHGMVVQPITPVAVPNKNEWKGDGFKLHMEGNWELMLTVLLNGKEEVVSFPVNI